MATTLIGKTASSRYPWILVGLLWVVAALNYLDRQAIFSVFPLLRAELDLNDVQLGLLGTVFLWVYGILSPFAGYAADRFGHRRVILASLVVWTAVTYLTGLVRDFGGLLCARALMGISEAAYIPAALAMITASHTGRSRSLAAGLHQTGLCTGMVLGGVVGGWMGAHYGWRLAFECLGVAGLVYAAVLAFTLKDGPAAHAGERAQPRFGAALKELFATQGFRAMVMAFTGLSIANWLTYTWLPMELYQRFGMSLSEAGFSATFYVQAATLASIVAGGTLADRWSRTAIRGRIYTQACGLAIAAPALLAIGFTHSRPVLVAGLILFGVARGLYDCNAMPALTQVAPPHLCATGYGVFNLAGCLAGGGMAVAAGALRSSVGLGGAYAISAVAVAATAILLARVHPHRA